MSNHPRAGRAPDGSHFHRTRQLRRAADRLEAVLQSLDLEEEAQLADEVAEAIRATDRAYERQIEDGVAERSSDGFVFPSALTDGGSDRDR